VIRQLFCSILFCVIAFSVAADDPLEKFFAGEKLFTKKKYSEARQTLLEFVAEHPYEAEVKKAWYYLALSAQALGDCQDAIARVNITQSRYANHENRIELGVVKGECLYRVNAHAQATKTLVPLLKQVKSDALRYRIERTLGLIGFSARSYKTASAHLKNAARLYEKTPNSDNDIYEVYRALAFIYLDNAAQVESAVAYLQKAIAIAETRKLAEAKRLKILLRNLTIRRIDKLNGLADNSIADIRVDGDDVYVATWGGGLVRYLRSQDKLEKIALPSAQLRGLYVDFDDIYVTSFDGVYRVEKKSGTVSALADAKGELKLGQKTIKDDRYIYFSTLNRGLIQYDTIKRKTVTLGKESWVQSNQVYALDADLDYIAVGTLDKGALIHNKKTGETVQITAHEGGLKSENVKAVLLDGRYVYIGAHNDGVYIYDMNKKSLTRLKLEIPFPSAFARRENEIYIGTSGQGIRVLDRNTNRVERITAIEGLSSNEVHVVRLEGEFLWVGYLERGIDVLFRPLKEK